MPVNYSTAAQNARLTAGRDLCADGTLELLTSGDAVLASIGLTATAGTVANGIWTIAFDGPATASAAGTATRARIKSAAGAVVVDGLTVSATGGSGEIRLDNPTLAAGQSVGLTSIAIDHA